MAKIQSIPEMEQVFLDASKTDDIPSITNHGDAIGGQDDGRPMSADDVRHDTAVLGRILINGYCGWPFHSDVVKRKVLKSLLEIYNNAHDMTTAQYFESLAPVLADIPDNHIRFEFMGRKIYSRLKKKGANVGRNIASDALDIGIKTQMRDDNIAVVGAVRMSRENAFARVLQSFAENIKNADALIVDLRGNGGGASMWSDELARHLFGADVPSAKRVLFRTNPDARRVWQTNQSILSGAPQRCLDTDTAVWAEFDTDAKFNPKYGYNKPIYILTDRVTASSAEMFVARMKHHPRVKLVGENTSGCEVYGNLGFVVLPHSRIIFWVGIQYRELEWENFETNGFAPDIRVPDGEDALCAALSHYEFQKSLLNSKENDR